MGWRVGLCAVGFLVLAAGCAGEDGDERRGRVLLIGIDGASPLVVEPMLEEGRLPNLAGVAREGVYGRLLSFLPLYSPRVWTTVATGKQPSKHGIRGFTIDGEDGERRVFLSHDRVAHALWNIASEAGLSVGVVNWWTTQPPDRVDGVMVTDHLFQEVREERRAFMQASLGDDSPPVFPADWLPRIQQVIEQDPGLTGVVDPFHDTEGLPHWVDTNFLSKRFRFDETLARIALDVDGETRPDLLMVLLPGIDKVSHFLWGALESNDELPPGLQFDPEQKQRSADALYRYYEYTDALLGKLIERFGPDDLVMVVSDHGFHVGGAMGKLTGIHKDKRAREAVLFARGPGVASGAAAGEVTVNDVVPTILAWWGLPVADDMDGKPAGFLGERAQEPLRIATYDTTPIERVGTSAPELEERLVEELEALGYLDETP